MPNLNWKNEAEKQRGYTDEAHDLILRMEKINLADPQPLDKRRIGKALRESYKIAELKWPKFVWKLDITDEDFKKDINARLEKNKSELKTVNSVDYVVMKCPVCGSKNAQSILRIHRFVITAVRMVTTSSLSRNRGLLPS